MNAVEESLKGKRQLWILIIESKNKNKNTIHCSWNFKKHKEIVEFMNFEKTINHKNRVYSKIDINTYYFITYILKLRDL